MNIPSLFLPRIYGVREVYDGGCEHYGKDGDNPFGRRGEVDSEVLEVRELLPFPYMDVVIKPVSISLEIQDRIVYEPCLGRRLKLRRVAPRERLAPLDVGAVPDAQAHGELILVPAVPERPLLQRGADAFGGVEKYDEYMYLLRLAEIGVEPPEMLLYTLRKRDFQLRRHKYGIRFKVSSAKIKIGIFHKSILLSHFVRDLLMPEDRVGILHIVDVLPLVCGGSQIFIDAVPLILLAASAGNAVGVIWVYVFHRGSPPQGIMVICGLGNFHAASGVQRKEPYIGMVYI